MDTLASLALATEPPTEELLNRKPYGRTKSIISSLMLRNIIGQSVYQLTVMFVILYAGQYFLDVESTVEKIQQDPHASKELSKQFTLVFNAFVLMTLFNEINSRKLHGERNVFKGIFRNPFFYCIWLSCFGAQVMNAYEAKPSPLILSRFSLSHSAIECSAVRDWISSSGATVYSSASDL